MEATYQIIFNSIVSGDRDTVVIKVSQALEEMQDPNEILNQGLIAAMKEVGNRFEDGDIFVPEMLIAARAMQAGLTILKPHLIESGVEAAGIVIIGTVQGDLHDIGKNLVAMMLEGAGYEIVDLGTDISPEKFAASAREHKAAIVGLSALLTTTMPSMKVTIEALEDIGIRDQVKVIVGGAPLTESFAKEIGADGYAQDASRAVKLVESLLK